MSKLLKKCLLVSTAIFSVFFLSNLSVKAQETNENVNAVDEIIVTGSRIKGINPDSFSPVGVISQEDILLSGKISIGEILLELPGQGSGLNRNYNNGGDGSVKVDFRNLTSSRTLVLVDGRRWVNGGEGANAAVDLNTIPTSSIERVEVLKDGASAVYGSDAIAAVVNIITKDNFEGLNASFQRGEYFDGGGMADSYDLSLGVKSDKGSILLGASYVDIKALGNGDRPQTAARPSFGGSSGTPQGRLAYGGVVGDCSNFQPSEGTNGSSPSDFRCWTSPDDRFNYNPYNYVETPNERKNFYAKGRYSITENTDVTLFGVYQNRISDQLLAPMPLFYGFGDFGGSEGISRNNPYNPFGIEFCDLNGESVEGKACNDANYPGGYANGWFGRRLLEAGERNFIQDTETYRVALGVESSIGKWDIDAYLIWAQNKNTTTTYGLLNTGNIRKGLSGDDCKGDCVPLNVFGGQGSDGSYLGDGLWDGSGTITQEMVDYITFVAHDTGMNEMKNYGFDVSGTIMELPSGPLGLAFGIEHRKEEGKYDPDAFIAAGLSSGNASSPVAGEFEVDEGYIELAVPVTETIDLSLAVRHSDYSSFGTTTNAKYGATWSPNEIVTFRATFAEGFRAPSIGTLYGGQLDSYPDLQDPCDALSDNFTGNADGSQLGQCANDGVPTGFTQPNTQIRITQGGNPDIQPEESEGINFGVIIKPIEGLSIYADYYEVEITNTISSIGAQLILNGCYQENNQRYCSLIDRNSTGFITDLRDLSNNIGLAETSGAELSVIYEWDDKYGSWIFSSEIAFLDTFDVTRADGSVEHRAGIVNGSDRDQYKEVKGNLGIIWSDNSWSASLSAQYHGEVDGIASAYPKTLSDGSAAIGDSVTKLDATWYLDGQVSYNFDEFSTRVTLGVDNLLDEDPPLFTDSFANDFDPSYRTWGSQFWYARVSSRF